MIAFPRKPFDSDPAVLTRPSESPAVGAALYAAAPCPRRSQARRPLDAEGVSRAEVENAEEPDERLEAAA